MNEERIIQQEIAPLAVSEETEPLPVEKKENQAAAFLKLKPTQKIVYIAIFTALAVVANIYTIPIIPPIAYISFVYIPVFFAGILLGPWAGFSVGIVGDLIGALIAPKGPYLPLIGLASGLIGLIPGIIFHIRVFKGSNKFINGFIFKTILCMVLVLLICTAFLNTFSLWMWFSSKSKTFWAYLWVRFPWQALVAVINGVLICGAYPLLTKLARRFSQ